MKLVKYIIATFILLSCVSQSVLAATTSNTRIIDFELKNKTKTKIFLQIHYYLHYLPKKRDRHYKQAIGIDPGKTFEENQIKIGKDRRILLRIFVGYLADEKEKYVYEIKVPETKNTVYLSYRLDGISTQKGTGLSGSKKTTSGKSLKYNIRSEDISKNLEFLRGPAKRHWLSFLRLMTNKEVEKAKTIEEIKNAFNKQKSKLRLSGKKLKEAETDKDKLLKYFSK